MKIDHLAHDAVLAYTRPLVAPAGAEKLQAHTEAARRAERPAAAKNAAGEKPDPVALQELADKAAERLTRHGVSLKFRVDDATGDLQVEVLDANNEKVIRKIPPDDLLKLSASLEELSAGGREGSFLNALF